MNQLGNTLCILDFGGQYAHLITNRIRRIGVHAIIKPHDTPADELKNCSGIILSGGPQSVNAPNSLLADPEIFELGIPILGICYGHQVTNKMLGGTVSPGKTKEYGKTKLIIDKPIGIFSELQTPNSELTVWMSHWDEVTEIPVDFEVLAHTDINDFAAVGNLKKQIYGIQFHPEVTHTQEGMQILKNFVDITRAEKNWKTENYLEQIKQEIINQVRTRNNVPNNAPLVRGATNESEEGVPKPASVKASKGFDKKVFMLVSGGVDSMVAFTLLNQILGEDQVHGMLVDTGFMRKGEIEEVQAALEKLGFHNLHVDDAKEDFYRALEGVSDPEEKRQIIGKKFIERQAQAILKLKLNPEHWLLGQGTIYPDTIESGGTDKADKIKTHHNRVPEIQDMINRGLIIEPLKDLYKDEVRHLGEQIGLPQHLVWRHPFPGPGLAIRILCTPSEIKKQGNKETRNESARFLVSLFPRLEEDNNEINKYLQSFNLKGTILPIQSVGVQGDARTYRHPLAYFQCKEEGRDEVEESPLSFQERVRVRWDGNSTGKKKSFKKSPPNSPIDLNRSIESSSPGVANQSHQLRSGPTITSPRIASNWSRKRISSSGTKSTGSTWKKKSSGNAPRCYSLYLLITRHQNASSFGPFLQSMPGRLISP
ncbi:MAG: glutamine-hydrolyzing GMP synthase [Candidatus Gracilibacteria bacterium]|nr:glutamine-hydrolyzing GMP synthase [Candidatus Gracilibacteria bacterium]